MESPFCPGDRHPFDLVTVERPEGADPDWYLITGTATAGTRQRRVPAGMLTEQAHAHLQIGHGKRWDEPVSAREWQHALTRAAVALLQD